MTTSLIGRTVGQYRVAAELGRGQHSVVYKAWQPSLERLVALKVLHHHEPDTLEKFQDEARLTAQLIQQGVPHIRQVYEVGRTADGQPFVALEYVDDSLHSVLRRARERNRLMSAEAVAQLLQPIGQALDAIHSLGWVHLDIKPQNILITKAGRAMLADFGITQRRGAQTHASTPAYASPEQAAGDRPVGPWSDIYSLGCVVYEMVAGHPPVRGDQEIVLLTQHLQTTPPSPRRVNRKLTPAQERSIFQALAKTPKDRHAAAGEFLQALLTAEPFLSSVVKTPSRLVSAPGGWSGQGRRRILLGAVLLLVLVGLLLAAWLLWPGFGANQPPAVETRVVTPAPTWTETPRPTSRPTATATRPPTATSPPTVTLAPMPAQAPP